MTEEQVRAAVEAAVRRAVIDPKRVDAAADERVGKAVGEIMFQIREYASDQYSRGRADGQFYESYYGGSGDF